MAAARIEVLVVKRQVHFKKKEDSGLQYLAARGGD